MNYLEKTTPGKLMDNGFPKRFSDVPLFTNDPVALSKIDKYMLGVKENLKEGRGIYISGSQGVGKTHLAAYIAKKFVEAYPYKRCIYSSVNDLVSKASDHYDSEEFDKLRKAPMVILDGLGTEYLGKTGYSLSVIVGFLRDRYDAMLPTIVTSRVGAANIASKYPELHSIVSQSMYVVQVNGKDLTATFNLSL